MSANNTPRPRRQAGHRPSSVTVAGRPRKVADSRRVAVRSATEPAGSATLEPTTPNGLPVAVMPSTPTEPEASGHDAQSSSRSGASRLTFALATLAVVLAVAVALVGWDLMRMDGRADARKAAQVVAADSAERILSYDHASYDKGVAAARSLMTKGFAKEYADTVDTVRAEVVETESVVKAEVVAASVVSAEADRVETLLFVNQTTTGKQVEQPRVDLNRVVVTLVRGREGAWLVSDVDAL